jgi:DNA-binding LacI/PurR family transcriptional regulator
MALAGSSNPGRGRFVAALLSESADLVNGRFYYGPMLRSMSEGLAARGLAMRPIQCLQEYQREHFLQTPPGFYAGMAVLGPLYVFRGFIEAVVRLFEGPKVMLDHHLEGLDMSSVREDALGGMRALAEHLLSVGHRRLAYVDLSDPQGNPWKRRGVDAALTAAGLQPLARGWVAGCREKKSDCAAALEWFLELDPRPTAVVCCDDIRALLLIEAARERGLEVPGDLSVTGYGETGVRTGRGDFLTTMAVEPEEMGRRASELLLRGAGEDPVAALVEPRLVVRRTTAPPGG